MKQKFINLSKKIKNKLSKFFINTWEIIKKDPLPFFYIIGAVLNGIILRTLTLGEVFSISPILADLVISLLFISFYFMFKPKYRRIYLWFLIILSVIICIANLVYYSYYDSFISVTFISFALTNRETGDSNVVMDLLKLKYFIILWFPIVMLILHIIFNKRNKEKSTIRRSKKILIPIYIWVLAFASLFLLSLKPIDYSRFYNQWNREYLVSRFGVYLYQINDVVKSLEPTMASLFGSDKAYKEVNEYYENISDKSPYNNEYTNIFEGKNVIAIHAESMQGANLSLSFNGKEVTPNLNRLAKEGLYFSNFYSQVSFGTSSDTEFTLATSLLPVNNGTVFINYSDRTYKSMYQLLHDKGYYTFSMHANTGDFWNRNIMYKALGYDNFYEKSSYELDDTIGFGLSDKSFFTQAVDKISEISQEHEHFYGTLITLSNHTPFDDTDAYGPFDVSMTVDGVKYDYLEGRKLGNYFKSSHYADEQLGLLIKLLDEKGLLENTIVVIYGDHDARISKSEWNYLYNYDYKTGGLLDESDPNYKNVDYYFYELNRKVPLIIWSKDKNFQENYKKEVTTTMGMYDLAPTLGNMLGFYNKYALGHDIFSVGNDNLVPFANGNFITNYVFYSDSKGEYITLKDTPLEEDYIKAKKEEAEKMLDISNNIIVYDYFKKQDSNEKYEEE